MSYNGFVGHEDTETQSFTKRVALACWIITIHLIMKLYFILVLISGFSFIAAAQEDTSAYEAQRRKINQLLADRSAKFGQYDESLSRRTGIFGLKTKKD